MHYAVALQPVCIARLANSRQRVWPHCKHLLSCLVRSEERFGSWLAWLIYAERQQSQQVRKRITSLHSLLKITACKMSIHAPDHWLMHLLLRLPAAQRIWHCCAAGAAGPTAAAAVHNASGSSKLHAKALIMMSVRFQQPSACGAICVFHMLHIRIL